MLLYLKLPQKERFVRIFRLVLYIVLTVGGVFLMFMWFGTNHVWTKANWNLVWMSPLFVLPLLFPSRKLSAIVGDIVTVPAALMLLLGWFLPQTFDITVYIIILLEIGVTLAFHQTFVFDKNLTKKK